MKTVQNAAIYENTEHNRNGAVGLFHLKGENSQNARCGTSVNNRVNLPLDRLNVERVQQHHNDWCKRCFPSLLPLLENPAVLPEEGSVTYG